MCSVCLAKECGLARVTSACNVAFKGFGVWVRLERRLPRPNIAFKGTRLGEAFLGSWVSSALGRCSSLVIGVPLNLTLGAIEGAITFQCRDAVAARAHSVADQ